MTTDYTYNPLTTRLTRIQIDDLLDLTYGYDSAGNVQEIYDGQHDETQRFEYDELDRLTHAFTSQGRVIGEVGQIYDMLTEAPQTVVLDHSYSNPVVFAQPLSYDGSDPSLVRITDVQSNRFTLYIDEPPNQDGLHPNAETVSYVVLEAGSWELPDGTLLKVGTLTTNKTVGKNVANSQWEHVSFAGFSATPVVLSQVQTENDAHFVSTRQRNGTATGFDVALEEDEAQTTWHGSETIGWLAIEAGSGNWSGHAYKTASTADSVTHDWYQINFGQSLASPRFLASLASYDGPDNAHLRYKSLTATSVKVKQEEDTTWDSEMEHTTEVVNYLALAGDGLLMAAELASNGPEDYDRTYTYNEIGNLISRSDLGIYTYPASGPGRVRPHAVISVTNGWTYDYDANGNMTYRDENSEYTQVFDIENRLVSVTAGGQTTTFTYDGDGNRVKRVAGGVTTVYIGGIYELEVETGIETKYYYLGSQRVAMNQDDVVYYLHGDHLGSTSLTTCGSETGCGGMGAEVARQWYYPYGETRWSDGTLPTDYQFTGQRAEGFGLYDYHARYYDGAIGRFISADTIVPQPGNPQDFNRYSYVRNSPLVYIDPSGHAQEESGTLPLGGELYWLPTYLDRWYEANPIPPNTTMEVAWHVTWAAQMAYADGVIGYDEFLNVETSAKALPFQDPMVAWAVAADAMQKGFYQYMVAMAMPNLFDMVTGYYDFWTYEGETYPSFNFTPSGSNRIGSRGVQLVAEHMPDVEIGQFRTLDGQRIYDGRLRSTGQYVEIKTSTQGVYYHSGQSPSQVAYDATHGNPVWIFVNCTAGGSLATDLGAANNIAVQTLNVPW